MYLRMNTHKRLNEKNQNIYDIDLHKDTKIQNYVQILVVYFIFLNSNFQNMQKNWNKFE